MPNLTEFWRWEGDLNSHARRTRESGFQPGAIPIPLTPPHIQLSNNLVPREGLEPPRLAALRPKRSVSAIPPAGHWTCRSELN
jgi:hypothetical protein